MRDLNDNGAALDGQPRGESESAANEIFMSGVAVSSSRPGFARGMSLIVRLDMESRIARGC